MSRTFADWLALREPADAAARATDLADMVGAQLAERPRTVIHDLGSGTGSMGRWLAPRLRGPQHWVMYDRDPDLLTRATAGIGSAADGAPVTVEARQYDVTRLTPQDLAGAGLVTASALLDMLTADEVEQVVAACAGAGCPTYLTISVVGRVELTPADPLDEQVAVAFNAHQRRTVDGQALLGPDAVDATVEAFSRWGAQVLVRPSPWRLGPDQGELVAEWFRGWVDAAIEQEPDLADALTQYTARRLTEAATGGLAAVVHHSDLLAVMNP